MIEHTKAFNKPITLIKSSMTRFYKPIEALPEDYVLVKIRFWYTDQYKIYETIGFMTRSYREVIFKRCDGTRINIDRIDSWTHLPILKQGEELE